MKSRIQSILERMREAEGLQNLIVWVVFGCAINALFFVAGKIAAKLLGIPIIGDIVRFLGYIPAGGLIIIYIGRFRINIREDWIINLLLRDREGDSQNSHVRNDFRKYRKGGYAYRKMCNYLDHCKAGTLELNSERYKEFNERMNKIAVEEEKSKIRLRTSICLVLPGSLGYAYLTTGQWRWVGPASQVITLAWATRTFLNIVEEDGFL